MSILNCPASSLVKQQSIRTTQSEGYHDLSTYFEIIVSDGVPAAGFVSPTQQLPKPRWEDLTRVSVGTACTVVHWKFPAFATGDSRLQAREARLDSGIAVCNLRATHAGNRSITEL